MNITRQLVSALEQAMEEHDANPYQEENSPWYIKARTALKAAKGEVKEDMIDESGIVPYAEFIVRACNSHDQLVSALEELMDWSGPAGNVREFQEKHLEARSKAKAALKAAKGGETS